MEPTRQEMNAGIAKAEGRTIYYCGLTPTNCPDYFTDTPACFGAIEKLGFVFLFEGYFCPQSSPQRKYQCLIYANPNDHKRWMRFDDEGDRIPIGDEVCDTPAEALATALYHAVKGTNDAK